MQQYCGNIIFIGRSNVGKSTLFNSIVRKKISIVSNRKQTTKDKILGIYTENNYQFICIDTPGTCLQYKKKESLYSQSLMKNLLNTIDIIVFVLDRFIWTEEEENILFLIQHYKVPCILIINKIDLIKNKMLLLPWIEKLRNIYNFNVILPMSAKMSIQIYSLAVELKHYLPIRSHLFLKNQITTKSSQYICSEFIREKIYRIYGEELPYCTTVQLERYHENRKFIYIHALIMVKKNNHKKIIIGKNGKKLKTVSKYAKFDIEKFFEKTVFLYCWCKLEK